MKKRTLVPTLAIFSVWALSAQCPAQDRMNVLLIVADMQRPWLLFGRVAQNLMLNEDIISQLGYPRHF